MEVEVEGKGAVRGEEIRELLVRAEAKDLENEKRQRDYTFIRREEEDKLDGRGGVKKTESRTSEMLGVYGEPGPRLTPKEDKPLSAGEAKKETEKIQKTTAKAKNVTE